MTSNLNKMLHLNYKTYNLINNVVVGHLFVYLTVLRQWKICWRSMYALDFVFGDKLYFVITREWYYFFDGHKRRKMKVTPKPLPCLLEQSAPCYFSCVFLRRYCDCYMYFYICPNPGIFHKYIWLFRVIPD